MICLLSRSSGFLVLLSILCCWSVSMERLEVSHIRYLFNNLFSCRGKILRFQHHVILLSHYRVCNVFPRGFSLKFHCGTIEESMQARVNSTLKKCSFKLRNLFEQYYKKRLIQLKLEEQNIIQSLKLFHPEEADTVLMQLQHRTSRLTEMYEVTRLKKYDRDGLKPRSREAGSVCVHESSLVPVRKCEPINLSDQSIDDALVSLCSKGPSFVPTPKSIDWNDLQESWLHFKRKVRWRSFFQGREITPHQSVENPIAAPYEKSTKEPPMSNVPAIEVFLNSVEKDLFNVDNVKKVRDNLSSDERKALKKFRNTPAIERDLIVHIQDKGHNFVILDNNLDAVKVSEQMSKGSFRALEKDISGDGLKHGNLLVCPKSWLSLLPSLVTNNPARVITSACGTPTENLSLFVEKYCKVVVDSIPCRVRDTSHM